ncbi:MAG: hypothetical protein WBN72_11880 [Nitrososphaeraceae archaeon]
MIVRKKTAVLLSRNSNTVLARQSLQFPIQLKKMTDEEIKDYHRKRLYELSLKTVGAVPWLDEPTQEQQQWINRRMRGPARRWLRWFVGHYFTEEQKKELELTDEDIAGKVMR